MHLFLTAFSILFSFFFILSRNKRRGRTCSSACLCDNMRQRNSSTYCWHEVSWCRTIKTKSSWYIQTLKEENNLHPGLRTESKEEEIEQRWMYNPKFTFLARWKWLDSCSDSGRWLLFWTGVDISGFWDVFDTGNLMDWISFVLYFKTLWEPYWIDDSLEH